MTPQAAVLMDRECSHCLGAALTDSQKECLKCSETEALKSRD